MEAKKLLVDEMLSNDEWAGLLTKDFAEMRITLVAHSPTNNAETKDHLNSNLIELRNSILKVREVLMSIRQERTTLKKQLGTENGKPIREE